MLGHFCWSQTSYVALRANLIMEPERVERLNYARLMGTKHYGFSLVRKLRCGDWQVPLWAGESLGASLPMAQAGGRDLVTAHFSRFAGKIWPLC